MKYFAYISFLSLLLSFTPTIAQTSPGETELSSPAVDNPTPAPCCTCFRMYVEGVSDDSQHPDDGRLWPSINGEFRADVTIVYSPTPPVGTVCPASVSVKVTGRVMAGGIQVHEEVKSITVTETETEKTLAFVLPADLARQGGEWEFSSYCPGDADSEEGQNEGLVKINDSKAGCEPITIKLGGGCKSCESGFCQLSGDGEMDEEGNCNLSTSGSEGGMTEGQLNYNPGGFSNPGTSALSANVPSGITVNRGPNGHITSIQTGTTLIEVKPAVADILAQDLNAFTVTHTATGQQVPFRTTTISFVTVNGASRLRMDSTFDSATTRHELTNPTEPAFPSFNQVGTTFNLSKGRVTNNGFVPLSCLVYVKNEPTPGKSIQRRRMTERYSESADWFTSSDIETTYEKQVRGWVKTKEIIDPTGDALTSTWTYYQPGDITGPGGSTKGLGRLKQETRYDGYESFHTYGLNTHTVTSPFAGDPAGEVTTSTWNPGAKSHTVTTTAGGHLISKTVTAHTPTTSTRTDYTSAGQTLVTTTTYKTSGQDFGGRTASILHPDGTRTVYSYTRNPDRGYTTEIQNLSATNGTNPVTGTRTTTTMDPRGNTISRSTVAIGDADGAIMESMTVTETEPLLGRPKKTLWLPANVTTTTTYNCCGVSSEEDIYGIKTRYAYDGLQRLVKTNRLGVTTATVRDTRQEIINFGEPTDWQIKGTFTKTYRYPETVQAELSPELQMDAANLISYSESNLAGTSTISSSPDPTSATPGALVDTATTVTYRPAAQPVPAEFGFHLAAYTTGPGISMRSVTIAPDGSSQTEARFLDGSTAITSGALAPTMIYGYSANPTGKVTTRSYVDRTGQVALAQRLRETTTTQSDWAGRTLRMDYMDGAFATMHYNTKGQMEKSIDPDGVATLMRYNPEGEQTITATDLNQNGSIDYGSDTVQFSETIPATMGSRAGFTTVSKVWQDGKSETQPTLVSTSFRSADGLFASSQSIGVSNPSASLTILSGNGNWTQTTTAPDGTKSLSTYTAGRMVSMASLATNNAVIESQTQGYDSLNRPTTSTHSRTGTTTTNYLSTTADVVKSVTDPGNRTTAFTYDIRGRQISVNAPDTLDANGATLANITTTSYFPEGTVQETNGDQTYRVSHTYDYADRQVTMTTYGTETATTEWKYSPDRGFLTEKNYHGETDNGVSDADYTYTAAGRLLTRKWERGITTTYGYDNGGRMTSTNYSDTTPDVTMSYDALGRQISQSNGLATSAFLYDPATLAIDREAITYNLPNQTAFTRVIDRSQDILQRDSGLDLKSGTTIENSVRYDYSPTDGRISSISNPQLSNVSFGYGYEPNSNLIKTLTSPIHTVTNLWETNRNVLQSKQNKIGATTISSYTYGVNSLGQRTNVAQTGTAFGSVRDIAWGYNAKGEVTKADSTIPGLDRAYAFDMIGNRLKSADSLTLPAANNYTPNALNQYSSITNPQSAILNPLHDADGNMTSGPLPANVNANSALVWDGENRLIQAQVNGGATVNFTYDAQSRRIAETVGSTTKLTVYDGWNPIAEYSTTYALTKTYIWGVDLSGSMQGAGGVGGLLAVTDSTGTYFPTFDGNGNVSEYLDSTGAIAAQYEYDPFGKTTVATGPKANDFAHRFSTKPLDATTGLYYYGYRYYDPMTGRWPSRDPIQERGGMNLYGFVHNQPIIWIDILGLSKKTDIGDGVGFVTKRVYSYLGKCCTGSCSDIIKKFKDDINQFTSSNNPLIDTPFTNRSGGSIKEGDILDIDGPATVNPSVEVIAEDANSVIFQTLEGHPESAKIKFSCEETTSSIDASKKDITFKIESLGQASTLTDVALYTSGDPLLDALAKRPVDSAHTGKDLSDSIGHSFVRGHGYIAQTKIWQNVLSKVAVKASCDEEDEFLLDYWWKNADEVPDEVKIK